MSAPNITPTVRTSWGAVVAVSLGIVLAALDMTVVAVVLPALGGDLHASPGATQWVMLVYSLPLAALSIPAGRWLDQAGPLPAFMLAIGGFAAASVLVAVAPTLPLVLLGRALQGAFGALIGSVGMPIIAGVVRSEHRARAMSIVLTLIPLAGVVGPAVGGLVADAFGWRAVFLVNAPIVAVAGWFGHRSIPARLGERAGLPLPPRSLLPEALTLGGATTALFLAINNPISTLAIPIVLILVAVAATVAWARLPDTRPVLALLTRPSVARPLIALPMFTASFGALSFLVPYFLAATAHASPRLIGLTLLTLAAGMATLSPVAGILADRYGNRPVALAGAFVALTGLTTLALVDDATGPADLAWRLALVGIGQGLFAGPNSAAVLAATPPQLAGTSGGLSSLLRTLGFAFGPAIGALTWTVAASPTEALATTVAVLLATTLIALAATASSPDGSLRRQVTPRAQR